MQDKEGLLRSIQLMEQLQKVSAETEEVNAAGNVEEIETIENPTRVPAAALGTTAEANALPSPLDSAMDDTFQRFYQPDSQALVSSASHPAYSQLLRPLPRFDIGERPVAHDYSWATTTRIVTYPLHHGFFDVIETVPAQDFEETPEQPRQSVHPSQALEGFEEIYSEIEAASSAETPAAASSQSASHPEFIQLLNSMPLDELKEIARVAQSTIDEPYQALSSREVQGFEDVYSTVQTEDRQQVAMTPGSLSQEAFKIYRAYIQEILSDIKASISASLNKIVATLSDEKIFEILENPKAKAKFLKENLATTSFNSSLAAIYKVKTQKLMESGKLPLPPLDSAASLELLGLIVDDFLNVMTHLDAAIEDEYVKYFISTPIETLSASLREQLNQLISEGKPADNFFLNNLPFWLMPKYDELIVKELNQILVDRAFEYLLQNETTQPSSQEYKQFISQVMEFDLNSEIPNHKLPRLSNLLLATFPNEKIFESCVTDSLQLDTCIKFDSIEDVKCILLGPTQKAAFNYASLMKILQSNRHFLRVIIDFATATHSQVMGALTSSSMQDAEKDLPMKLVKLYYHQMQRSFELTNKHIFIQGIEQEMARIHLLMQLAVTAAFRFDQPAILEDQLFKRILSKIILQETLHGLLDKIDKVATNTLLDYQTKLQDTIKRLREQVEKLENKPSVSSTTQFLATQPPAQPEVTLERITLLERQVKFLEMKVAKLSNRSADAARPRL